MNYVVLLNIYKTKDVPYKCGEFYVQANQGLKTQVMQVVTKPMFWIFSLFSSKLYSPIDIGLR